MLNGHPHSQVMLSEIEIPPSKNASRLSYCNGRNITTSKRKRNFLTISGCYWDFRQVSFYCGISNRQLMSSTNWAFVGATHSSTVTYIKCSDISHNHVPIKNTGITNFSYLKMLRSIFKCSMFKFSVVSFLNGRVVKIVYPL